MSRILILSLVLLSLNGFAQSNKLLDSLLSVNERYVKEDTTKVKMLVDLANTYEEIDLNKAIEKSTQAVALAKQLNYPFWLAKAYEENASNLMFVSKFDESVMAFEAATKIYTALGDKKNQIRMANNVGNAYFLSKNYPKAREFYEKAANEAEKIGDKRTQARALCNAANVYDNQLEYDKSITSSEKGILLFEQLGDQKSVARNVGNLGVTYIHMNNYKKALDSFFRAKKANEAMGNKFDLANNFINIAFVYGIFNDRINQLKYQQEALSIYESIGRKDLSVIALSNIGIDYWEIGDYKKSVESFSRSLKIAEELKDVNKIVTNSMSLGENYAKINEYSKAFIYIQKIKQYNGQELLPDTKMSLAFGNAFVLRVSPDSILRQTGIVPTERFVKAEEFLLTALKIARELDNKFYEVKILNELSLVYEQKGDYVKAYDYYRKSIELQKQLDGEDLKKQTTRKEVEYEFDKKESELIFQQKLTTEQLEKQRLLTTQREQELTLNNQQLRLKTQALALSDKEKTLQRLAYLKERAEKQEKEQLLKLAEKDKQLQSSQLTTLIKDKALQLQTLAKKNALIALLITSLIILLLLALAYYLWQKQKTLKQEKTNNMNFTKQLLESTEEERKRIASDLHDSISHDLLSLKSGLSQDTHLISNKIDSIINDIRIISRNLHPVMFDKIGLEPNIEQLVERIQTQNNFMVSTDLNYQGSLTSADELQIYRIFQEALTNIIKYAKAHAAKITMQEMSDKIFIEIKDNGKGFNVKETLNSSKSFGLHNIIERSRVVGGEANIKSSDEGTVITINIPKKS